MPKLTIDKTFVELFLEQVDKTPDSICAIFNNEKITYNKINENSNKIAHYLNELGTEKGNIIGIYANRSIEFLTCILGIFKAGAAYVPIDPVYPESRVKYIVEDTKMSIISTEKELLSENIISPSINNIICIDDDKQKNINVSKITNINYIYENYSEKNIDIYPSLNDLSYIIYTSGSTGKPKGAMVEHKGMINHILAKIDYLKLDEKDIIAQTASASFDISVWQFLSLLITGGKVIIIDPDTSRDPEAILEVIKSEKITTLELVPSMISAILEVVNKTDSEYQLQDIRWLLSTGEALSPQLARRWFDAYPKIPIVNAYGPTEASDDITHYTLTEKPDENMKEIPIGRPLPNFKIYILNKRMGLCMPNVKGEICVAGTGVGRGYLNQPEKTKKVFVDNPYSKSKKYSKLYKTGDIGKYLPDGNIIFYGRSDFQVKIRGYRIELEEIESILKEYNKINEVITIAKSINNNDSILIAYYTSHDGIKIKEDNIRKFLDDKIPNYMIPSYFVHLDKMPLNVSRKIDRNNLPDIDISSYKNNDYEEPVSEMEKNMANIWSDILNISKIGRNDNFFNIGGHSLLATQVILKIKKKYNLIDIKLTDLFLHQTLKEFSSFIKSKTKISNDNNYTPLQIVDKRKYYETSHAQKRLWISHKLNPKSTEYNLPAILEINGDLNIKIFNKTINKVIGRHEIFRTSFDEINNEIIQIVHDIKNYEINYHNICDYGKTEKDEYYNKLIEKNQKHLFNLNKPELLKISLVKYEESKHILLVNMHHIITDGWSGDIFISEMSNIYKQYMNNENTELPIIKKQYKEYSYWHNQLIYENKIKSQEDYWLNKLSGELENTKLITDYPRQDKFNRKGRKFYFQVEKDLDKKLDKLAKNENITSYILFLTAFNILLHKYTQNNDIIITTPVSGRSHPDTQNMIGFFVNILPIRNKIESEMTIKNLIRNIKNTVLEANENQDYPFDLIVNKLNIKKEAMHLPLSDISFIFRVDDGNDEAELYNDLIIKPIQKKDSTNLDSPFEMLFTLVKSNDKLTGEIFYRSNIVKNDTIKRLSNHYINILNEISNNLDKKIAEINILSQEEENKLLFDFNNTKTFYHKDKLIHQLFEQQALKTPNRIALEFNNEKISYQQLNERANQLARFLIIKGITPGAVVGLMMVHSIETVVAILAVLKAGGSYIPVDVSCPLERKGFILEDSGVNVILINSLIDTNFEFDGHLIDIRQSEIYQGQASNLDIKRSPRDLAYIIYTSGSTGRPKGAMIEHRGLVNYIYWAKKVYIKDEEQAFALYSSLAFDLTVTSIFTPLINGNKIVIYQDDCNEYVLYRIMRENKVNILKLTPAHMLLIKDLDNRSSNISTLIVGGEDLKTTLAGSVYQSFGSSVEIFNEYGPTETVVGCMIHKYDPEVDKSGSVPIGVPADNVQIYILDKNMNPFPLDTIGELFISGDGVAKGYINGEELTKDKFIPNPFIDGQIMYKTGDLARFIDNGTKIEYVGRLDHQVKIRGFRIELGEIEKVLLKNKDIKESIVIDRKDEDNNNFLCAYIVSDKEININEIRSFLGNGLPDYMIPSYFIKLDKLPLNQNGKVNRKLLPNPDSSIETGTENIAPQDEIEEKMVEMWKNILKADKVGINDNFFHLGGNSLKAVITIDKIKRVFKTEIDTIDFLKNPTIKGIIEKMKDKKNSRYTSLTIINKGKNSEKPLFFIHESTGGLLGYRHLIKKFNDIIPLYGLKSQGIDGKSSPINSIEEMASHYINEIDTLNIKEQKVIIGWSLGGIIAYEMVKQLENTGNEILLLVPIDISPKKKYNDNLIIDEDKIIIELAENYLDINENELRGLNTDEKISKIISKENTIISELNKDELRNMIRIDINNRGAYHKYYMKNKINAPILSIKASNGKFYNDTWDNWTNNKVEEIIIPGNHHSIMNNLEVKSIYDKIKEYLYKYHSILV